MRAPVNGPKRRTVRAFLSRRCRKCGTEYFVSRGNHPGKPFLRCPACKPPVLMPEREP